MLVWAWRGFFLGEANDTVCTRVVAQPLTKVARFKRLSMSQKWLQGPTYLYLLVSLRSSSALC